MKYLISASAAVLMLGSVSADVIAQDEAPVTEENNEELVVEQCNCDLLNGFYAGLGIGYSNSKNKIHTLNKIAGTTVDGEIAETSNKANKFIGTIVLGGGKVFGQGFYVGAEGMIDFSKNKKKYEKNTKTTSAGAEAYRVNQFNAENNPIVTKTENKGFEWNLGVRAGYAVQNGTLVYAKVGMTQAKMKETVYMAKSATDYKNAADTQPSLIKNSADGVINKSWNCNKVAPMIALGVEKVMSNRLSGRVEIEYDFKAKKKITNPIDATKDKLKIQRKNGFKVRLLLSKHISM